jgi:hypothetical protein
MTVSEVALSDPSLNDHLHYPNDLDGPLNETVAEKYANTALTIIIVRLTLSPVCLLLLVRLGGYIVNQVVPLFFFQDHRETDLFLTASGVHLE